MINAPGELGKLSQMLKKQSSIKNPYFFLNKVKKIITLFMKNSSLNFIEEHKKIKIIKNSRLHCNSIILQKLFNEEQQPHNSIKNSLIISNELNQLNFGKQNAIFQADSSEDNFMNEMKNDSLSANNVCGTSKKLPGNLHLSDIYTEYGYSPVPVNSLLPYSNQALLSNSRTSSPTQQKQSIFSSGEIIDLKIQGDPTTEEEIRNSIHACLDCSKTFRRLQDLRRHKANIHERIILNTCKHCAKKFTRSDALFRHINKKRCKEMK